MTGCDRLLLLNASLLLTRSSCKTHQRFMFRMPRGAKRLIIDLSYAPKYETDMQSLSCEMMALIHQAIGPTDDPAVIAEAARRANAMTRVSNLLTLSVDSPAGNVGASHRQDDPIRVIIGRNATHSPDSEATATLTLSAGIGKDASSPGYNTVEMVEGIWSVWIHVHGEASPCLTATLTVQAECDGADMTDPFSLCPQVSALDGGFTP